MNIVAVDKHWKVVKCRCCGNYYKYLCKITETMWYVTVYDSDDETLLYAANWMSLNDAIYDYNHYRREGNDR